MGIMDDFNHHQKLMKIMRQQKRHRFRDAFSISQRASASMYPRWELNPHSHCCERDFKSRVSTNSTTRVSLI